MTLVNAGYLLPDDVRSDFGFQTNIKPANPAAGAAFTRRTPGNFYEIPITIKMVYTASATVANRFPVLSIIDGDGGTILTVSSATGMAASQSLTCNYDVKYIQQWNGNTFTTHLPLPTILLLPGWSVRINADNLQAGDQINSISMVFQQYETGVEPERLRGLSPLDTAELGTLSPLSVVTATGSPSGAAAPTGGGGGGGGGAAATPSATPAISYPTPAQLAAASSQGGPVIRE